MAEYATTPQLVITDTFTTLVTDFNTVSSGLGATWGFNYKCKDYYSWSNK